MKTPKAMRVFLGTNSSVWRIQWPSKQGRTWGKTYFAVCGDQNGDSVSYLQTGAQRRRVADRTAAKLITAVYAALAAAKEG